MKYSELFVISLILVTSCQNFDRKDITKEFLEYSLTKDGYIESFDNRGEEFFFVKITGMASTEDRYIFIDDARSAAYSTDKNFKNFIEIATSGEGLGEFFSIGNISKPNSKNNQFAINDLRSNKFVIFNEIGEVLDEIKLERGLEPWENGVSFENDEILYVKGNSISNPEFTYHLLNTSNKELKTIKIAGTEDTPGNGFYAFQIKNKYLFVSTETYPTYLVTNKNGELLKVINLTNYPILEKNTSIAAEKLKSFQGLNASIILFEHVFLANERIFILSYIWTSVDSYRINMVLELTLDKKNSLNIEKVFYLDNEENYSAIMVDDKRLITSSKRSGYLDIYTLPD